METKKTERASLEEKKNVYFLIGLVIVLAITFFAFEIKSYNKKIQEISMAVNTEAEEDLMINTSRETPPPPPPEQPQVTQLEIVEDDVVIDDDFEIDAEADENSEIKDQIVTAKEEEDVKEEEIFSFVEEEPKYPGGEDARLKYLQDNLKYPEMAKEGNISGVVYITFVVEKDGKVTNVKVLRGIGGGCDEEAIRVIKAMPKWSPGKQRTRPVRTQFNMPIKFTLAG